MHYRPARALGSVVNMQNQYTSRGHFDPTVDPPPAYTDFQKPVIYVTDPENQENELWAPQQHDRHSHTLDEDSDDGTCSSNSPIEVPDEKVDISMGNHEFTSSSSIEEMSFYRTGWQNRIVRAGDESANGMLYYADIPWTAWGTSLTIRQESREGTIIAEVKRRPGRPFELNFPTHRPEETIILKFGCIYSQTHKFSYRGRDLAWTHGFNTRRLKDVNTGEVLAQFNNKHLSLHKDGKLVFLGDYAEDREWVDVIVVTALTCQQREREIRRRAQQASGGGP